jgi:hypothetical protein
LIDSLRKSSSIVEEIRADVKQALRFRSGDVEVLFTVAYKFEHTLPPSIGKRLAPIWLVDVLVRV